MQLSVPEIAALAERRTRALLGLDLYDEVWSGEYRMAPAPHWVHGYLHDQVIRLFGEAADARGLIGTSPFNLGDPTDYRVPDHGYHRTRPLGVWNPTAALVIEIVSPGDASLQKFDFYRRPGRRRSNCGESADPKRTLYRPCNRGKCRMVGRSRARNDRG